MLNVPATEVKHRLGQYLEAALIEPVIVEKSGRPSIVMLSIAEYERLQALEDQIWGERARLAEKGGFVGEQALLQLVKDRLDNDETES